VRPREPKPVAKRSVTVTDEKVEQPSWQRVYLTPSHATAAPGEAEALEVLAHLIGGGATSFLYRALVVDSHKAVAAGAYYASSALDDTRFILYGMPSPGVSLSELDAAFDAALEAFVTQGVAADELERGKTRLVAEAVYAQDSQAMLARWYGASLATGLTIADIKAWPSRIEAVTAEGVVDAARKWLDGRRAVTGYLTHPESEAA